jgi:hypothetical protein
MCSRGEAPDLVKLGRRTLIPAASASAWLAARIRPAIEISQARPGGAAA